MRIGKGLIKRETERERIELTAGGGGGADSFESVSGAVCSLSEEELPPLSVPAVPHIRI